MSRNERIHLIWEASQEVRKPMIFGEIIILIVYLPILTLTGVEGKMFTPMALTVLPCFDRGAGVVVHVCSRCGGCVSVEANVAKVNLLAVGQERFICRLSRCNSRRRWWWSPQR